MTGQSNAPLPALARWYASLYTQVLVAVAIGIALGYFAPHWAVSLKPLGDGFIKLIRMLIAPIIFTTVVGGIAGMSDMKKVGDTMLKEWLEKAGPEGQAVVDAYRKM